jgi:DNA-binding NarL/FixJ family response regulator
VGSVDTLAAAREAYRAQKPSLVLLDLWLPDGDGLDFAGELRMQSASARIIACTVRKDAVALHKCERMGLNGMICKEPLLAKNLRLAMRTVLEGRRWVSPEMAARMASLRTDPNAYYKILSDREQELLPLLGRGDSDASIAALEGVSPYTVRNQRLGILRKLGLARAADLIRAAASLGFVRPDASEVRAKSMTNLGTEEPKDGAA